MLISVKDFKNTKDKKCKNTIDLKRYRRIKNKICISPRQALLLKIETSKDYLLVTFFTKRRKKCLPKKWLSPSL